VLSTWRSHYHYLCKGGDPTKLEKIIKDGKSMSVFDKDLNFISSSIVGGNAPIAVGLAMALKRSGSNQHVYSFIGDGGTDEGAFFEAARFEGL
jgi:pyruvate dehydrogenase E1 component alpha subunit